MDVGGQAVIEGVMMRNKERFAVAVRLSNGELKVMEKKNKKFPKIFNVFFVRGIVGLGFTLIDGIKALIWSGNQQIEKEEEKVTKGEITLTILTSFLFALVIFVGIPFIVAHFTAKGSNIWFNVLDGVLRVGLFLGYLIIISFMDDVKRLFQYHGAEHKVITCYEKKFDLNPNTAKKCSRFHPRCGTSFIFLVLILSIVMFSFIQGDWWVKLIGRILLLPVISGIGYELIKLSSKRLNNPVVKLIVAPGLWLQRLTTKEPDKKQIEVAIKALNRVVN